VAFVEAAREPGQHVLHTIQTNATLLDDAWAEFFAEHGFLVGDSVDGPREVQDTYRVDKGGKPTFDRVMAGLRTIQLHDVYWNALTTVHRTNHDRALEVYRFLRDDLGATFVQFIPIVERVGPEGPRRPTRLPPQGYGRFLVDVFEEWLWRDIGTVFVQMFDVALAQWVGADPSLCVHAKTCDTALALEHTGDVYACDHFVDPEHLLATSASVTSSSSSPVRSRWRSDATSGTPCRGSAVSAGCASSATAAAPRTLRHSPERRHRPVLPVPQLHPYFQHVRPLQQRRPCSATAGTRTRSVGSSPSRTGGVTRRRPVRAAAALRGARALEPMRAQER
jgi:anaerobic sulfatase-maturating enzyme